jgi:hypothetical protein
MTLSVALDTNVLARLLVNDDPAQADHLGLVWLQGEVESTAMGLGWHSPTETDGWLAALAEAAALSPGSSLNAYGEQVLETSFSNWCTHRLRGQTSQ